MDDFYSSIWLHQESIDEIRQNLQNTLLELETLKMEANEKSRTHREEVDQLLTLLESTQQERDEARQQISQFLIQTQNTSSRTTTESNSFSGDGSSSPPSSSELSSFMNIHHSQLSMILKDPTARNHHQHDPLDVLVMGKAFPETGKLLKAVVEAGPLLQTLLVAGQLPKWVNPPPQTQSQQRFELPPLSFEGCDDVSSSGASGRCDSLMCSGMSFGLGSVFDQTTLTGKRQRLE